MSETIVTGKKYRILTDVAQKVWQRVSFWTKSTDVEFNDAKTAETKVGAIDGITDSLSSNSSRIAASAKAVNQLNGDLNDNLNELNSEFTDFKSGEGYGGNMWMHGLYIGDQKTIFIFQNPEDDTGFNVQITKNNINYYWSFATDGHIYFNGNKVI